ncbi:MAG: type I-F CRISPR-associated protein Csy1 [Sedimenticola sp.]
MDTQTGQPNDSANIHAVINQFLQERLQPKLDKLKEGEDEKRQALIDAYQPVIWIADAARRVSQIQQVTHAIKYTHPDAKGTSLNSQGNPVAGELLVGTHTLNGSPPTDVVGNAAALDVYKFLRLAVNGKTLLQLASDSDPALASTLSADAEVAQGWMVAFAGITEPKGEPSSHKLAKQLYWPLDNGRYHLLAPLFPTALVQGINSGIREDRFSEAAKAAREARKNKKPHSHGFREYPNFAIQKFGGTKPQNISQLNSERHGENMLIAALPPSWKNNRTGPPLKVETVFDRWLNRNRRIYRLTSTLRKFLLKVQPVNNIDIHEKRAELVASIVDEVIQIAAQLRDLSPGWSQHKECRLNIDECYWLDPFRGLDDPEFSATRSKTNWQDVIYDRFANWLNARLNTDKTPMSNAEHAAWRSALKAEQSMLREELKYHD